MKFSASQFTPTKWSTAEDKAWFANQFVKFVSSGFERKHFTERFYRRLSNTFGHIAHYDQHGFWATFFTSPTSIVRFLEETLRHPCFGDPEWTYSDVERELQNWLNVEETLATFRQRLDVETNAAERAAYERLRTTFEPSTG